MKRPLIGDLLQKLGYVTPEQLQVALAVQRIKGKLLGELLIDLDFVTSDEVAEAIAMQSSAPFVDLDRRPPENEALKLVSKELCLKYTLLPLEVENETLIVAVEDPEDLEAYDQLYASTGYDIEFVVAAREKILRYIQIYYYQLENPIEESIKGAIDKNREEFDAVGFVDLLLKLAIKERATDLHITPLRESSHVFYRLDGVLKHYFAFEKRFHAPVISRIKILSSMNIAEQRLPQDGAFVFDFLGSGYDIRSSTLPTANGENMVMRILFKDSALFNIKRLGFSKEHIRTIRKNFSKPNGIILISGPTGSGKTTTLYSGLRLIDNLKKNILSVEDPIEYRFSFIKQSQVNEKAGYTFAKAVRNFMRQDPDVMLIGEIRDEDTAELAVRASITGHLVLSTIHTNSAAGVVSRLEDFGVKSYLLAEALRMAVSQRLLRRLCDYCKEEMFVDAQYLKRELSENISLEGDRVKIYGAKGCFRCRGTGYNGRVAAASIIEFDDELKDMIIKGKSAIEIERAAAGRGMATLFEDMVAKLLAGLTSLEEIKRVAG